MRDDSFTSFLVDDGNRRAYDLCLAVARSEPLSPMPVSIVGEPGAGKTHLLRAVANRLRASAGHAAIVYLAPGQPAPQIDQLVEDPAPIDMARYGVLLIDDLDRFENNVNNVLRLIEIFLENDHPVLAAMSVHPERLAASPPGLRRLLLGGQVVAMEPGDALQAIERLEARLRDENQQTIKKLRLRIEELENGGPEAASERNRVRAAEFDKMRRQLAEARDEIDHLRGETALLGAAAKEAEGLRARVNELEEQRLHDTKQAPEQDEVPELKRKLDQARFDAQKAREDARGMLERAEKLLRDLHKNRTEFEAAHRESKQYRDDIRKLESIFSGETLTLIDNLCEEDGEPFEQARPPVFSPKPDAPNAPTEELTALREEVQSLREELQRMQEGLVRAHAERDNAKSHLARVRDELEETRRDLANAREEAETLLAERDERIRGLEQSLVERRGEYERLQEAQNDVAEEMLSLQSQLSEGTDVLERLMELFGIPPEELERVVNETQPDTSQGAGPRAEPDVSDASTEKNDEPDDRADFGEGLRLVPRHGSSLHHVEEIRAGLEALLPESRSPLEDGGDDDESMYGSHPKTA